MRFQNKSFISKLAGLVPIFQIRWKTSETQAFVFSSLLFGNIPFLFIVYRTMPYHSGQQSVLNVNFWFFEMYLHVPWETSGNEMGKRSYSPPDLCEIMYYSIEEMGFWSRSWYNGFRPLELEKGRKNPALDLYYLSLSFKKLQF